MKDIYLNHINEIIPDVIRGLDIQPGSVSGNVTLGFERLDDLLGAIHQGEIIAIASRPAFGKTTLMLDIAIANVLKDDFSTPVIFFCGYESSSLIASKALSNLGGVKQSKIRQKSLNSFEWKEIFLAEENLKEKPLYVCDQIRSPVEVEQVAMRVAREWGCKPLLIFDGLEQLKFNRKECFESQSEEVFSYLKSVSENFGFTFIVSTNVSNKIEEREDKTPRMHDLYEIIESEIYIDKVLTLYRAGVYDEQVDPEDVLIRVLKNSKGGTGACGLRFDRNYAKFKV